MHVKILKLWHQWGWAFHISAWIAGATALICTYGSATASNAQAIADLQRENLPVRMAVQENTAQDIHSSLTEIKQVQGKIFERINQIADRQYKDRPQ